MQPAGPRLSDPLATARRTLLAEAETLQLLAKSLDSHFGVVLEALRDAPGRVACSGMGKAGLVMRKLAATLSSTGTPAFFLHPADAAHGDLGMLLPGDVLLCGSHSGSTREVVMLAQAARERGVTTVAMTGHPQSELGTCCMLVLPVPVAREACPHNLAPTSTTTALMAMGDALAMALMEERQFQPAHFATNHPGGALGRLLRPVAEVMAQGAARPLVPTRATLREVAAEISAKGLGIVGVVDGERLVGCISDGDLRRLLERGALEGSASSCMRPSPRQIGPSATVREARDMMHAHRITALFVTEEERVLGVVQIHQLSA